MHKASDIYLCIVCIDITIALCYNKATDADLYNRFCKTATSKRFTVAPG